MTIMEEKYNQDIEELKKKSDSILTELKNCRHWTDRIRFFNSLVAELRKLDIVKKKLFLFQRQPKVMEFFYALDFNDVFSEIKEIFYARMSSRNRAMGFVVTDARGNHSFGSHWFWHNKMLDEFFLGRIGKSPKIECFDLRRKESFDEDFFYSSGYEEPSLAEVLSGIKELLESKAVIWIFNNLSQMPENEANNFWMNFYENFWEKISNIDYKREWFILIILNEEETIYNNLPPFLFSDDLNEVAQSDKIYLASPLRKTSQNTIEQWLIAEKNCKDTFIFQKNEELFDPQTPLADLIDKTETAEACLKVVADKMQYKFKPTNVPLKWILSIKD